MTIKRLLPLTVLVGLVLFSSRVESGCLAGGVGSGPNNCVFSTIYIDPGHGESEGQCTGNSAQGICEDEANLRVGKKLDELLYTNFTTYMSRCEGWYPDYGSRVQESIALGADIYVSIHHNAAGPEAEGSEFVFDYNGVQQQKWATVVGSGGETFGDLVLGLGTRIGDELSSEFGITNRHCKYGKTGGMPAGYEHWCGSNSGPAYRSSYWINQCQVPAVVGEAWFVTATGSSAVAADYLDDPEDVADKEAAAYKRAIEDYVQWFCYIPIIPGSFTATGGSQIILSWAVLPDEFDSWSIYRSDNCFSPWELIHTGPSTEPDSTDANGWDYYSFEDVTALGGHEYHYRLVDHNPSGDGYEWYESASLWGSSNPPAIPQNLSATDVSVGTDSRVQLNWDSVPGATGYRIYRTTSTAAADCYPDFVQTLGEVTTNSWLDDYPGTGVENYYRVQAYDATFNSNVSDGVSIPIASSPCSPMRIDSVQVEANGIYCGAEVTWSTLYPVACTITWGPSSDPTANSTTTPSSTSHSVILCGDPGSNEFLISAQLPGCLELDEAGGHWVNATCISGICDDQVSDITVTPNASSCEVTLSWTTQVDVDCSVIWGESGNLNNSLATSGTSHSFTVPIVGGDSFEAQVTAQLPCCPTSQTQSTTWNYSECYCGAIQNLAVIPGPNCEATASWTTSVNATCTVRWGTVGNLGSPTVVGPGTNHSFGPMTYTPNGSYQIEVSLPTGCTQVLPWKIKHCIGGWPVEQGLVTEVRRISPNPTQAWSAITFSLSESGNVQLSVFDVKGALVRTLVNESLPAGVYERTWDGRGSGGVRVAKGVYYLVFRGPGAETKHKLTIL